LSEPSGDPKPVVAAEGAKIEEDKPAAAEGAAGASQWRAAIQDIRSRVEFSAKVLGGVGTTAATAVGIDRIGDLYPVSHTVWSWVWFGLAIIGFAGLAAAILFVTYRLWSVSQPVRVRADLESMKKSERLSPAEEHEVSALFTETARLNGHNDLRAYEAREGRLTRIAARISDEKERGRIEQMAAAIRADLEVTFARAAHLVVRRRASNAIRDSMSQAAYGVFVVGFLLFALGTDYVSSERTEQVAIAKSCAEARTADATRLPEICGAASDAAKDADASSPAAERVGAAAALGEPLQRCLGLIETGATTDASCDRIAEAMSSLAASHDAGR